MGVETVKERRDRVKKDLSRTNPQLHWHLFADHPKRMLALDGGGVLGVIEIAFLERMEELLRDKYANPEMTLSDHFDLIGGTSTGAIIATSLALGMTTSEIKTLYFDFARRIFRRPTLSVPYLMPKFDARVLMNKLRRTLGDRELRSEDLKTGLAIVSKRVDTGSPWVLTNNPAAMYWEGTASHIGNKYYKLRDVVRASTAAPYYYSPKKIQVVSREDPGLFVDGGVTPHNTPALQLLMLANIRGYGFLWPMGVDKISMISIGAGWARPLITQASFWDNFSALAAVNTLKSVIWDSQVNTIKMLQWISEPRLPWPINSEVGTLENEFLGTDFGQSQELLKFQRYDVMIDYNEEFQDRFGPQVSDAQRERLRDFMNPGIMNEAYALAREAAQIQVDTIDFTA